MRNRLCQQAGEVNGEKTGSDAVIVDAQVHIWTASTPERPWPAIVHPMQSRPHKPEPITAEVMLREMDAAGVDRAVIAPPVWEGVRNDYALAAAQRHPHRFAESVTMFTEEMPWLPAADLNWIMGRGLCEWIGWKT
jgi:predicted TIM-barrel fold metal-dependent hydrolase